MTIPRKIISLPKKENNDEAETTDNPIPVAIFDILLPARQFSIRHKIAVVGEVSLTTEFLLRLLHAADGIHEQDASKFFGFNSNEMAYVIKDAEARAYIYRSEGRLWLSEAGLSLFKDGDKPQIFDVIKRTENIAFDLLSLAPCDREYLSDFESALPRLSIRNEELVANASKYVPEAFRRFYNEISSKKSKDVSDILKRSLYSVDEIIAGDRFATLVPFVAMANSRKPNEPEPVMDIWKNGNESENRTEIVHGIADFLENLRTPRKTEDNNAFEVLAEVTNSYLKDFVTKSGFSSPRFFKETSSRTGELRSNRKTVGIIGSLYLPDNIKRIESAIKYSAESEHVDKEVFLWLSPTSASWGCSRYFVNLIKKISRNEADFNAKYNDNERTPIIINEGEAAYHVSRAVPVTYTRPRNGAIPSSLEILLIPRRAVAITVHAPVGESRGFPIPLGVISFDQAVVQKVHDYLLLNLPSRIFKNLSEESIDIHGHLKWVKSAEQLGDLT